MEDKRVKEFIERIKAKKIKLSAEAQPANQTVENNQPKHFDKETIKQLFEKFKS